ncbi:DNA binding [Microdochium nivale]|nr:DNA binding [Microdochium nivale]
MSHLTDTAPRPRRRTPTACRLCRKQRKKCNHVGLEPCQSCVEANLANECDYAQRGEQNVDRQHRHPRQRRTDRGARSDSVPLHRDPGSGHAVEQQHLPTSSRNLLPDTNTIMVGVDAFFRKFNQLGFLQSDIFAQQIREDASSISSFLLCSILAVSARFVRSLRDHYGEGSGAVSDLTNRAEQASRIEMFEQATLERCQAFFLLSVAQQGCGRIQASYTSASVALSMVVELGLHREATYVTMLCTHVPQPRLVAESARRTFWYIYCLNNSISGPGRPLTLSPQDISTYHLSDDSAFDNRSRLASVSPENQISTTSQSRLNILRPPSLASYLQILDLWGAAARLAVNKDTRRAPPRSERLAELLRRLEEWDQNRPLDQAFAASLLPGYRNQFLDLAYLETNATFRLCHVVLRKMYLDDMIRRSPNSPPLSEDDTMIHRGMIKDLFIQIRHLYQILNARFEHGAVEDRVGSAATCFQLYTVGIMATYLWNCPYLDGQVAITNLPAHDGVRDEALRMYARVARLLQACRVVWPVAESWLEDMEKCHRDLDTGMLRASVDMLFTNVSKAGQSYSGIRSLANHRQLEDQSILRERPFETVEHLPRLAPLHNIHRADATEPLSLPPLKNDQYRTSGQVPPLLSTPPAIWPPSQAIPTVTSYFQDRQPQVFQDRKHNTHFQVVLDHKPHHLPPATTGSSGVSQSPLQRDEAWAQQEAYTTSRSPYGHDQLPSLHASQNSSHHHSGTYKRSCSTSPKALSEIAAAAAAVTSGLYHQQRASSDKNNDRDTTDVGLGDGFEWNLAAFLKTGALWAAADENGRATGRSQSTATTTITTSANGQTPSQPSPTAASSGRGGSGGGGDFGAIVVGTLNQPLSSLSSYTLSRREERGSVGTFDASVSSD